MNDRASDVLTFLIGLGAFPLAWIVWTYTPESWPWGLLRLASFLCVPTGILLLVIWFSDNPVRSVPVFGRLVRRFEGSRRTTLALFPFMLVAILFTLLVLSSQAPIVWGPRPQDNTFFTGLFTLMAGLVITFSWLGEKEDYSRTAYALKSGSGGGPGPLQGYGPSPRPFPRASPGPQPSERQREDMKYGTALANLLGLSVTIAGILLMIASALLA